MMHSVKYVFFLCILSFNKASKSYKEMEGMDQHP